MHEITPSGWRTNQFGRFVSPAEGQRLKDLRAKYPLEIEERMQAYLLRSPRWGRQVMRVSAKALLANPVMANRFLRKAVEMMPVGPGYAGVHVKDISCNSLIAFRYREEHRAKLEA